MNEKDEKQIKKVQALALEAGIEPWHYAYPYELIMESEIINGQDRFYFTATGGRGGLGRFITEIPLAPQDIFFAVEWGLYLLNAESSDDVSFEASTFPDSRLFGKRFGEVFSEDVTGEANIFYNADLALYVNNALVSPATRTDCFRLEMTQEQRSIAGVTGMKETPNILPLTGTKHCVFHLKLPREIVWPSWYHTRVRLRLRGFLMMNATVIT
jgi:hypothetical protein